MPGGGLKGGSSCNQSKDQDLPNAGEENIEKLNGLERMEKLNGLERLEKLKENEVDEGGHKRGPLDGDLFLQWGNRKRPRGTRLEPKHGTVDASVPSKKTIRVDRRVEKAGKRLVVSQIQATVYSRGQALRPCTPALHENGFGLGRRNGLDFSTSSKCAPVGGINDCAPTDARRFVHNTAERPDRPASFSPHKNDTSFAFPQGTDYSSPDDGVAASTLQNTGEAAQTLSPSLHKVESELFEWPRILISLSRKEKEDDFMAINGSKLPHRPKRRPKVVQKALHFCSPGIWLSDLTRGRYDVREKFVKKKPRGLKAMESSDSDSD